MHQIFTVPNPGALPALMPDLAAALGNRRKIALYGDMGAGKTTLVKAFCVWLGVQGHTNSPTFSLVNEYAYTDAAGQPAKLHHLDLYRLQRPEEALDIGIEDLLYDPWFCFIEWPQVIAPLLPPDTVRLEIQVTGPLSRQISLTVVR
jgi:tRNA threonylcarbamoyladenosine biosynthesis protein TsaE